MDKSAEEITFDEKGVCNFCVQAQKAIDEICCGDWQKIKLDIKKQKGKYDVIVGLSGGIDSSTVLDIVVKEGLKPLCFSIDNGWNDPIADENIMRLVEGLKVPFYRYTIDLDKFRELQASFLQAGLINAEIPSDHIIISSAFDLANKYGVKYIISGGNVASESIMPYSWSYHARDYKHLSSVYKTMTGKRLKGLPTMNLLKFNYYKWIKKIKVVNVLDYFDYNVVESKKDLSERYGWQDYGDKHEESIWTKWFQNFYLFEKFGIDKRKAHYSSLINSGQMTRDEALFKLTANPIYPRLGIEDRVMKYPKHDHMDYPNNLNLFNRISKVVKFFR